MPVAINRAVIIAAAPREDQRIRAWSEAMCGSGEFVLGRERAEPEKGWVKYLQGVAWVLGETGLKLRGMDAAICSEVPRGVGLSSSAALEIAWALALLEVSRQHLPPKQLALACQRAENEYVGMRCGILDQFASVFGRPQTAILIDCDTLKVEEVPMPGEEISLVVCDTSKPRQLVDSEYNRRRAQCEEGARRLGLQSLREATPDLVMKARAELGDEVFKRCWHVVTENERVLEAAASLRRGDLAGCGRLMSASHRSARDYYEISCPELEAMWSATQKAGCYGSRVVGAGFGGAILALVPVEHTEAFITQVERDYREATGRQPNILAVQIANGAEVLTSTGQIIEESCCWEGA